jgi:hypothetical protein
VGDHPSVRSLDVDGTCEYTLHEGAELEREWIICIFLDLPDELRFGAHLVRLHHHSAAIEEQREEERSAGRAVGGGEGAECDRAAIAEEALHGGEVEAHAGLHFCLPYRRVQTAATRL